MLVIYSTQHKLRMLHIHVTHQQHRKSYEVHKPEGKITAGPPVRSCLLKCICELGGSINLQLTSDF